MSVIGEGTFCCVHKPSLKCDTTEIVDYTDKISKLLIKSEADSELKEYSKLKKIDPNEKYYLGAPIKCKVENSPENIQSIKLCKNHNKFLRNMDRDNIRLLLLKDGGDSLYNILKKELPKRNREEKKNLCELILIYFYNIFNAIKLFNKKKVFHRDIKSENIVFNFEKKNINLIDFGLMDNYKNAERQAKRNKYGFGLIWWSIPPYSIFINKVEFDKCDYYLNNFDSFINENNIKKGEQMDIFYNRISKNNLLNINYVKEDLINKLKTTLIDCKNNDFNLVLKNIFPLIDLHNLGMTLLDILSYAKLYIDNNNFIEKSKIIGLELISFDVFNHIDINKSIRLYSDALIKSGMLEKHNLKIINNELISIENISNTSESQKYSMQTILKKLETNIINNRNKEKCSENKELNPNTNKCVKKCEPNYKRDDNFKCIKIKTSPVKQSKKTPIKKIKKLNKTKKMVRFQEPSKKKTPPGKILNRETGRYINIPKHWNEYSKKTTQKTQKTKKITKSDLELLNRLTNILQKTKTQKTTPPGKMRNPKTGRYINIPKTTTQKTTPPGKMRNPKTGRLINKPTFTIKKCPRGKVLNPKTNRCVEEYRKRKLLFF